MASRLPRAAARVPYEPTALPDTPVFDCCCAYDGSEFDGWQTQPHGNTVQDAVEQRLTKLFGGAVVQICGAGRTDKGVHARGQHFHFTVPTAHGLTASLMRGISDADAAAARMQQCLTGLPENSGLPASVQVLSVTARPPGFHARDSCVGKRYAYTVEEGVGDPFSARYRWALGRRAKLDVAAMNAAAALLVGKRDFSTFATMTPGDTRDVVKHLRRLEVIRVAEPTAYDAGVVTVVAEADRFLMHMCRFLAGTLVQVGLGKLSPADVASFLEAADRAKDAPAPYKAPARGLCLEEVFYEGEWAESSG